MKIISINVFGGKNVFSMRPAARMLVDLEEYAETPTAEIKDFNEKLIAMFPGLKKHACGLGYEGGFLDRLYEGTYLAHVTEHLIIEMQNLIGCDVKYGKARQESGSRYYIVYEHSCPQIAQLIGQFGVDIINSLIKNKDIMDINADQKLQTLKSAMEEYTLGPSTSAICAVAKSRGIPVMRIGNRSLVQLGYGKYQRRIQATVSDDISCLSADLASDKYNSKILLQDVGIPVPDGVEAFDFETAKSEAVRLGFPLVVKPLLGSQGKGVTVDISSIQQLKSAFKEAKKIDKWVIIEKYIKGYDYRVLVIGDKVSAVARREPASIIGDGIHNIQELIQIENTSSLRGNDHEKVLTKIKIDNIMEKYLLQKGLTLQTVPVKGEKVFLRSNANLSTGGKAIDCTDSICEENKKIAVLAAKTLGLSIAGIDIISQDISKPLYEQNGVIIEINAAPGIRMHLYPSCGHSRNVAEDIVDFLYPNKLTPQIPIIAVTGTNGKTTTVKMLNQIFSKMGKVVGMTSTTGVYVDNECILEGDNTGPISARTILSNNKVEVAILETARGGLIKRGLAYDLSDVGVITNIAGDHLNIDGIRTIDDIVYIKSLVIETVKPDGYAVLNADDENTPKILPRVKSKIIYFSKSVNNPIISEHIKNGGIAVCLKDNCITIIRSNVICKLINVNEIPATSNSRITCNIENALAACGAAIGADVPLQAIREGLISFRCDINTNPGRFNLFKINNFHVMVDYGHNLDSYKQVIDFVKKTKSKRKIGIIGIPGDRRNEDAEAIAQLCSESFDKLYIKEDIDLRGRKSGEMVSIFANAIKNNSLNSNYIIEKNEINALRAAISDAEQGDFIVIFYEDHKGVMNLLKELNQSSIGETTKENIVLENKNIV